MKRYTFHRVTSPVHSVIRLFPLFALSKIWAITCKRETLLHSRPVEVSTYLHSVYKPMLVAVSSHGLTSDLKRPPVPRLVRRRVRTAAWSFSGWQQGGGFFRTCALYRDVVPPRLAMERGGLLSNEHKNPQGFLPHFSHHHLVVSFHRTLPPHSNSQASLRSLSPTEPSSTLQSSA